MNPNPSSSISRKVAWLLIGAVLILGNLMTSLAGFGESSGDFSLGDPLGSLVEPERFSERLLEGSGSDTIVLLRAEGILLDSAQEDLFGASGVVPIERLSRQIDQAAADEAVKAIILLVDSPGGTVTASQTIHEKLLAAKSAGKPIVILMRETAASGGYYIATAGDTIVANPSTLTGSIGVIMQLANLEGLYAKLGYAPITLKAGEFKDIGSADRALTTVERAMLQTLLDEEYERFLTVVATGRELSLEQARAVAEGKVYSGSQAKAVGLVDELGNLPTAIAAAKREAGLDEAQVVEYQGSLDSLGVFSQLFGGTAVKQLMASLGGVGPTGPSGLLYLWQP